MKNEEENSILPFMKILKIEDSGNKGQETCTLNLGKITHELVQIE